jgi:hypothetical protein
MHAVALFPRCTTRIHAAPWETKHKDIKKLFGQITRQGVDIRLELMTKAFKLEFFSLRVGVGDSRGEECLAACG